MMDSTVLFGTKDDGARSTIATLESGDMSEKISATLPAFVDFPPARYLRSPKKSVSIFLLLRANILVSRRRGELTEQSVVDETNS